jgi:2-polyprenyl-3-methyl-5-hydroxy-6-metoxy-1,4-benzoquinol methylase
MEFEWLRMYDDNINDTYFDFSKRKRVLHNFVDWIKDEVPEGAKLLDAGCGHGFILKLCEKSGWNTYGIDFSRHAIKRAKQFTKAPLICQDIDKTSFSDGFFDAIILFDMIEHVKNPYNTLEEVKRILKKGGVLAIHTPNANSLGRHFATLLHREWFGEHKTHIHLFTPFTLKLLLKRLIFETIKIETPFKPFPKPLSLSRSGLGGAIWLIAKKI